VLGSLVGAEDDRLTLAANAEEILAAADTMYDDFVAAVDEHLRSSGIDVPEPRPQPPRTPVSSPATLSLTEAGISSVVWSTGFDFDYGWLHAACLDATGAPVQSRGVTEVPGLYFLGLHWMHTFKSGTFMGIGDDAAYVADHLAHHLRMESRP
jgi:putative flavoprotein involved in K+ transport